jgi:hypothetical protein
MNTPIFVRALLDRLREWWRKQEELSAFDYKEEGLVAADLRVCTNALKDLIARGPRPIPTISAHARTGHIESRR